MQYDKSLLEYLEYVRHLIQDFNDSKIEQYQEEILSNNRINIRVRLRFSDNSLLQISEAIFLKAEESSWLSYRYHYQDSSKKLVFRYDNTPHYPDISTHPDHKHEGDQVLESSRPTIEQVLLEIKNFLK